MGLDQSGVLTVGSLVPKELVNVLTKGQGGAILPMEDTNPQELKKIESGTSRE